MKDPMKIYSENKKEPTESPKKFQNLEFEGNMTIPKNSEKIAKDI